MRAVLMTATGAPDVLQQHDVATPNAGDHELLVRLKAAGVNPLDTKLRARGTYFPQRMPAILGCDGAGVVEAVGPAVSRYQPGDAVYFCNGGVGGHPGNYAEYAVVDERYAAAKPRTVSFVEAAAAPLVLITAWEALFDRGRLQASQSVLVHAGAGGVGHVAIQLARLHGARVATTVTGADKIEMARNLGAELVIDYRTADFVTAVQEWNPGGAHLALDTVGGETFINTIDALRHCGDLVTLLQPGGDVDWKSARLKNLRIGFELMLTPMIEGLIEAQRHHADILTRCAEYFDAGKLRIHVARTFPLAQAAEAHRLLEAGGIMGKLVLNIDAGEEV